MRSQYLSTGSNTTLKTGHGQVHRIISSGANGGSIFVVDSIDIGVTPDYPAQISNASNLAAIYPLTAAPSSIDLDGLKFSVGLTVAATSNASITVLFD